MQEGPDVAPFDSELKSTEDYLLYLGARHQQRQIPPPAPRQPNHQQELQLKKSSLRYPSLVMMNNGWRSNVSYLGRIRSMLKYFCTSTTFLCSMMVSMATLS